MTLPCPSLLAPTLRALEPSLDHVVLVGGWAHQLHLNHPGAGTLGADPLTTEDCDFALPLRMPDPGLPTLADRLEMNGFALELSGANAYPKHRYRSGDHPSFSVEFITPRQGDGLRRDGSRRSNEEFSGLRAEALRFVSLALASPWECEIEMEGGERRELLVVHPVNFLVGKMLVSRAENRPPSAQAKDLFYVIESMRLFEGALESEEFQMAYHSALKLLGKNGRRRLDESVRSHFGRDEDDPGETLFVASEIASGLGRVAHSAAELRSIGRYGWWMLSGEPLISP